MLLLAKNRTNVALCESEQIERNLHSFAHTKTQRSRRTISSIFVSRTKLLCIQTNQTSPVVFRSSFVNRSAHEVASRTRRVIVRSKCTNRTIQQTLVCMKQSFQPFDWIVFKCTSESCSSARLANANESKYWLWICAFFSHYKQWMNTQNRETRNCQRLKQMSIERELNFSTSLVSSSNSTTATATATVKTTLIYPSRLVVVVGC